MQQDTKNSPANVQHGRTVNLQIKKLAVHLTLINSAAETTCLELSCIQVVKYCTQLYKIIWLNSLLFLNLRF